MEEKKTMLAIHPPFCVEKETKKHLCMEEKNKHFYVKKKKCLPYLPSIETGTLVRVTADITAAT